jgi:hypothetical protein
MSPILKYFSYEHLPPKLQEISKSFYELAVDYDGKFIGPEKEVGMRKLLEGKDCFVRAALNESVEGLE